MGAVTANQQDPAQACSHNQKAYPAGLSDAAGQPPVYPPAKDLGIPLAAPAPTLFQKLQRHGFGRHCLVAVCSVFLTHILLNFLASSSRLHTIGLPGWIEKQPRSARRWQPRKRGLMKLLHACDDRHIKPVGSALMPASNQGYPFPALS